MKLSCKINPLVTKNLCSITKIREEEIIIEQKSLLYENIRRQIKELSRDELQSLMAVALVAYNREKGKNYFFESLLYVIDQQLKKKFIL